MTDKETPVRSQEERQAELAPETHNDEQDDHRSQAQEVAEQALDPQSRQSGSTESRKPAPSAEEELTGTGDDLIDEMREMEDSGRIDNGAYAGEPNHDDNVGKYAGKERD